MIHISTFSWLKSMQSHNFSLRASKQNTQPVPSATLPAAVIKRYIFNTQSVSCTGESIREKKPNFLNDYAAKTKCILQYTQIQGATGVWESRTQIPLLCSNVYTSENDANTLDLVMHINHSPASWLFTFSQAYQQLVSEAFVTNRTRWWEGEGSGCPPPEHFE